MVRQAFSENLFYRTLTGDCFCIEILLREKCPNTEFFLVRVFPHSDWIRRDTHSFSTYVNFIENLFLLLLKICFIEKFLHKGVRIRGFSFLEDFAYLPNEWSRICFPWNIQRCSKQLFSCTSVNIRLCSVENIYFFLKIIWVHEDPFVVALL